MSRPTSVTLLAVGVFCLAVFNLLGLMSGIQRYAFVSQLPVNVSPAYLIISHALWSLIFGGVGFGLWRLKQWGRLGALAALSLYAAQGWFDRLVLSRADYLRVTTPFALFISLLSLGVVWAVLLRRSVRDLFSN